MPCRTMSFLERLQTWRWIVKLKLDAYKKALQSCLRALVGCECKKPELVFHLNQWHAGGKADQGAHYEISAQINRKEKKTMAMKPGYAAPKAAKKPAPKKAAPKKKK